MISIGLLQTDSVLPHLQEIHGDYPAMFRQVLEQTGLDFELSIHDSFHKASVDGFDKARKRYEKRIDNSTEKICSELKKLLLAQ